ncbi:MAG: 16S rRNA (adenine(1518)-N(6)/adenine(1519)-N(6))-dimethyltransferase RsmA [Bacillota bacterium]|nr:16S rRNA (adenine(1518)-N(6)/adenine(1519)-N(6))-dimethyltransferase RsmA [Bacillota bacterium]
MYDNIMIKQILQGMSVHPHRLRGQNFLINDSVVEQIIAATRLSPEDYVIEIGPGLGVLSQKLAEIGAPCLLLEIEDAFAARLQDLFTFEPHVKLLCLDALDFDFSAYCAEEGISAYHLVANLPYNITSPMMKKLLLHGGPWERATLMLQKEAAQRICAGSGRENGPLTLLTQYCAEAELLFDVPPEAFYPQPSVRSAVIQLRRREEPPVDAAPDALLHLIDAAFSQRRKQLVNTLTAFYQRSDGRRFSRADLLPLIEACGLKPGIRAEEMDLFAFAALLQKLEKK